MLLSNQFFALNNMKWNGCGVWQWFHSTTIPRQGPFVLCTSVPLGKCTAKQLNNNYCGEVPGEVPRTPRQPHDFGIQLGEYPFIQHNRWIPLMCIWHPRLGSNINLLLTCSIHSLYGWTSFVKGVAHMYFVTKPDTDAPTQQIWALLLTEVQHL